MAATPSPNLNDQQVLAGDLTLQSRVREAVIATCFAICNEAITEAHHYARARFAVQTLQNILSSPAQYGTFFAQCVATDSFCLADATVGGTVALTTGNVATQAPLVTDAHINSALSSQWNSFFNPAQQ